MSAPKYYKPKILLIDMSSECADALVAAGYNAQAGSFGARWNLVNSGEEEVRLEEYHLPNVEEQEIIIVDLAGPAPHQSMPTFRARRTDFIQVDPQDVVNPRPFAMRLARPAFDKIADFGGIFIVLLAHQQQLMYGTKRDRDTQELSTWGFLSMLSEGIQSSPCKGEEVYYERWQLPNTLKKCASRTSYACSIEPAYYFREQFVPLAKNKYGSDIAAMVFDAEKKIFLLMLPQIENFHDIIVEIVEDICPILNPTLFPHLEVAPWLHSPEYEIPKVIELQTATDRIKAEADEKVKELETQVDEVRAAEKDWYTLLNGTDDDLVDAVIRTLQRIGFKDVIKVDDEAQAAGTKNREDIRIHDRSPILVLEVKGINNKPSDEDVMQAGKHARMRARELKGQDVQALTVINHERHKPPHDRDPKPYRDEIVANAEQTGDGLMTTWDLFRLLRNMERLGWPSAAVMDVFYRTGRIEPVPSHYLCIGEIIKVFPKAPAFVFNPLEAVQVGDRLAVESGASFVELVATSLRMNDENVEAAEPGVACGVACNEVGGLREGASVYRVK